MTLIYIYIYIYKYIDDIPQLSPINASKSRNPNESELDAVHHWASPLCFRQGSAKLQGAWPSQRNRSHPTGNSHAIYPGCFKKGSYQKVCYTNDTDNWRSFPPIIQYP